MSITFSQAFGGGAGGLLAPGIFDNFFASRTWTAPQDGVAIVRAMGAGGGGARGGNATGGYSGSWGVKAIRVSKGDTIVVSVGAGGAGRSGSDGDGTAGGDTTVTVHGVTYTAYGGPNGVFNAASALPNGPAPSSNWDMGASSVKPGWLSGTSRTGGAGVDILAQGFNATTSDAFTASGGGGTGGQSAGGTGGGAQGTAASTGQPAANPGVYFDAGGGDWGISFYGGSGGGNNPSVGGNGGGGGASSTGAAGGNGGGGGAATAGAGGNGGRGGGGGAATTTAGTGGGGFAHLKFFADMGV